MALTLIFFPFVSPRAAENPGSSLKKLDTVIRRSRPVLFPLATLATMIAGSTAHAVHLDSTPIQLGNLGAGGANSVVWAQVPGNPSLFLGRYLNGDCKPDCTFELILASMNWTTSALTAVGSVFSPPQVIQGGIVVTNAYDPTIVSYNGELWVAFECDYVGGATAGSCLGPLTNGRIDATRTVVAVRGDSNGPNDPYYHSASVPKLLVFNGGIYLYYTTVRIRKSDLVWMDLATRGVQLSQESGGLRRLWAAGSNQPIPAVSYHSQEVMGIDPDNPSSQVTADSFGVSTDGTYVYLTGGLGGTGCFNPLGTSVGCYRMSISRSPTPLGFHVFNKFMVPESDLPGNPSQYSRIFSLPDGIPEMMTEFLNPVAGTPASTVVPPGFERFPYDLSTLNYLPNQRVYSPGELSLSGAQIIRLASGFLFYQGGTDGNLVLYNAFSVPLWHAHVFPGCTGQTCRMVFQEDGNLVLYRNDVPYWNSGSSGGAGASFKLSMSQPYLEVLGAGGSVLWASSTRFSTGSLVLGSGQSVDFSAQGQSFMLMMQSDGNLVLYKNPYTPGGAAIWSSGTWGHACASGCQAIFQEDGNFVLYDRGSAYWSTRTIAPDAMLVLDGSAPYITIHDSQGASIWDTGLRQ